MPLMVVILVTCSPFGSLEYKEGQNKVCEVYFLKTLPIFSAPFNEDLSTDDPEMRNYILRTNDD